MGWDKPITEIMPLCSLRKKGGERMYLCGGDPCVDVSVVTVQRSKVIATVLFLLQVAPMILSIDKRHGEHDTGVSVFLGENPAKRHICMAGVCRESIEKAFLSYAFGEALYDKNAH